MLFVRSFRRCSYVKRCTQIFSVLVQSISLFNHSRLLVCLAQDKNEWCTTCASQHRQQVLASIHMWIAAAFQMQSALLLNMFICFFGMCVSFPKWKMFNLCGMTLHYERAILTIMNSPNANPLPQQFQFQRYRNYETFGAKLITFFLIWNIH